MNFIKKIKSNNGIGKSGFTIIETLVAITILMVAVAGPLTVAQKGLTASIYARDQVSASFFAQEGIEIIKNELRNVWISSGNPINCTSASFFGKFTRSCDAFRLSPDEINIRITVTWTNGTVSNSVSLTNDMFNVNL